MLEVEWREKVQDAEAKPSLGAVLERAGWRHPQARLTCVNNLQDIVTRLFI